VAAGVALAGCTSPISIAPSTHPIPPDKTMTRLGPAQGSSWSGLILGIIPFGSRSPLKSARDVALKETNADALIGVTVESRSWFLLFLNLKQTFVEGEAVMLTD
jgi:hypothetical protein